MIPDNISPEEARLLTPRRAPKPAAPEVERHKEDITAQDYILRKRREQNRNNVLLTEQKKASTARAERIWRAKVGATYAEASTDRPEVMERVRRLVSNEGRHRTSIAFYGKLGVGKSWQAYAYIAEAIKAGAVTPSQIVMENETGLIGAIAIGGFRRTEIIDQITAFNNKIYFIDDVGSAYFSKDDAKHDAWFNVIDHIYNHQLTLIITTNLPPERLEKWMGPRAYDRMLSLLGGPQGFIDLGNVNKRPGVAQQQEARYRKPPTAGSKTSY
jgi:DNA replication protein DnaC